MANTSTTAVNTIYKRYNGSTWDEVYFKTSAGQVVVSTSRKFVTTSTKVNGKAFSLDATGEGASATIYASDIAMSSSDSTTIASKLASDYQPLDADLTAIAGLSGTSGFLKKTAADTWSLVNETYTTTGTKYSSSSAGVALGGTSSSPTITVTGGSIASGNTSVVTGGTVYAVTNTLAPKASPTFSGTVTMPFTSEGLVKTSSTGVLSVDTNAYAVTMSGLVSGSDATFLSNTVKMYAENMYMDTDEASAGYTLKSKIEALTTQITKNQGYAIYHTLSSSIASTYGNSVFNSNDDTITLTKGLLVTSASGASSGTNLPLSTFTYVGINVYVQETSVPDRWVSAITKDSDGNITSVTFSKLETAKVDLSGYATKATTLAGYNIGDAYISSGTIKLGSNSITPLTASSTLDATKLSGTIPSSCYTNTTYSDATTSAHGLMTATMVTKLNGITESADSVSFSATLTSGTKIGTITINGTDTDLYCSTDTDTDKKTASTASTGALLYLIGASSQSSSGQDTKSNANCYVGTDNALYSRANRLPNTYVNSSSANITTMITGDICLEGTFSA